jgi:hypothetical protein
VLWLDAMMIEGDRLDVARAKSTSSPATEFSAMVAWEKRDANVRTSG